MSTPRTIITEPFALTLEIPSIMKLTDEQFFAFCQLNRDYGIERNAHGEIIIMAPAGAETGWRNSELIIDFGNWARQDGTGVVFDSSTGFRLSTGSTRSPDVAWVRRERLSGFTRQQRQKFLPLCPDFVVELRSPSDSVKDLQRKMEEYIQSGARGGWLIDPVNRRVYVYHPDTPVERVDAPDHISDEAVLPAFVLALDRIWEADF
ncbi:MAG: Uma2 family endonuclease [Anaerolineales bacterium]